MKGKRYTTEDKIRLLREADRGEKSVLELCREANISEVSGVDQKSEPGRTYQAIKQIKIVKHFTNNACTLSATWLSVLAASD